MRAPPFVGATRVVSTAGGDPLRTFMRGWRRSSDLPARRVRDLRDGSELGIRPARHNDLTGCSTPYRPRAIDEELRTVLRDPGARVVILHGVAGAGKRRCAYEAVRAVLPNHWLYRLSRTSRVPAVGEALTGQVARATRVVLWLDDFEPRVADRDGTLMPALLGLLSDPGRDVAIVLTMTPNEFATFVPPPEPTHPLWNLREEYSRFFTTARSLHVVRHRARGAADSAQAGDVPLATPDLEYAADSDVTFSAPEDIPLLRRYFSAADRRHPGAGLVEIAADAQRAGLRPDLSERALRESLALASPDSLAGPPGAASPVAWSFATDDAFGQPLIVRNGRGRCHVHPRLVDMRCRSPIPDATWHAVLSEATAEQAFDIGLAAHESRRDDYAMVAFDKAARQGVPGASHLLGLATAGSGRPDRAVTILRAALDEIGTGSPAQAIAVRGSLAHVLGQSGNVDAAIEELEQLLAGLPPAALATLTVRYQLCRWKCQNPRSGEEAQRLALAELAQVAQEHARLHPGDLTGQLALRKGLASETLRLGVEPGHAIGVFSALVRQCVTTFGGAHPWSLSAEWSLAQLWRESGNTSRLEPLLRALVHRFRAFLGPRHVRTIDVRRDWLLALAVTGQVATAVAGLRELAADCREGLGERNPTTLAVSGDLATWLGRLGRHAEAIALLESILESESVVFGRGHPRVCRTNCQLADVRGHLDPVRAYRELSVLLDRQRNALGDQHEDVAVTRARRDAWERSCMVQVARQSIYDLDGRVFGYELFFRDSGGAVSASRRDAPATSQVMINAFTDLNIAEVVGGRRCFLNITREFLTGELPLPVAADEVVLELLDSIEVDDAVLSRVQALREAGYQLAVDSAGWRRSHVRLLPHISYLKVDVEDLDEDTAVSIATMARAHSQLRLIGHRIATAEQRARAVELGCSLLQGHALARPETVSSQAVPLSRLRHAQLLGALSHPEEDIDLNHITRLVSGDAGLSSRVLKMCNSAQAGLSRVVTSILGAVVLLGPRRLREWLFLMDLSELVEGDEGQLTTMIDWIRLHQVIGPRIGVAEDTAFLTGLFGEIAAITRRPLSEVVSEYPLGGELTKEITEREGAIARLLEIVAVYRGQEPPGDSPQVNSVVVGLSSSHLEAMRYASTMSSLITA